MSHAPPVVTIIDPDPPTDPRPGRDGVICMGCGAANLVDPHCASCVQLAMFCDVASHVSDLEHAREDEATMRKGLWIDSGRHALWLIVVTVMALSGVRNPMAYVATVFAQAALFLAFRPFVQTAMHKITQHRAAVVFDDLDMRPDDMPARYLDAPFIAQRVRDLYARSEHARVHAQMPSDPSRGTDFDVPPPPLRPE